MLQGLQNLSVNCFLEDALPRMRDRCDGLNSCQVAADDDTFQLPPADPCPAAARYLEAHYVCNSRTGELCAHIGW
jgi:Galactose binding lectin domain